MARSRRRVIADVSESDSQDEPVNISTEHGETNNEVNDETNGQTNDNTTLTSPSQSDDTSAGSLLNQANIDNYLFKHGLSNRQLALAKLGGLRFCKAALAAELKGQIMTKGYISKTVLQSSTQSQLAPLQQLREVKYAHIYKCAQGYLHTLGFELVPIANKPDEQVDPVKLQQFLSYPFVLRSKLSQPYRNIIGNYFLDQEDGNVEETDHPNAGLLFGIMLLVVWSVILHKNNISRKELETIVKKFGIGASKFEEVITNGVRQEYVVEERVVSGERGHAKRRRVGVSSNGIGSERPDEHILYHVGRRTRLEFSKKQMLNFLEDIYGEEFNSEKAEQSLKEIWADEGENED